MISTCAERSCCYNKGKGIGWNLRWSCDEEDMGDDDDEGMESGKSVECRV